MTDEEIDPNVFFGQRSLRVCDNPIVNLFFHTDNINHIIDATKKAVDKDLPSDDKSFSLIKNSIVPMMENIYIDEFQNTSSAFYSQNICNLEGIIEILNDLTASKLYNSILDNVLSQRRMIKDMTNPIDPMQYPEFTNIKGSNELELPIGFSSVNQINAEIRNYNNKNQPQYMNV
jgi:hypothetical protein